MLPICFHNLKGYDGYILIRAVNERHGNVRVIPTNMERFMAFSIGQLQFFDTFQFTMKSLGELVSTLDNNDFKFTQEVFTTDELFYLMKKRGVFPYDYFNDITKLDSIVFPSKEAFFDKLPDSECSMKDYLHAKLVWNTFNCQTFKNYHDLYLKSDVLLAADFFVKFREMCLKSYGLDAAHYFSAPGMAFNAALKMTKVKLELFTSEDMYSFIERPIRSGVSQISKRYATANNKQCHDYDPLKPITT